MADSSLSLNRASVMFNCDVWDAFDVGLQRIDLVRASTYESTLSTTLFPRLYWPNITNFNNLH